MLGFKAISSARPIHGGIEMVHMMRKGQARCVREAQSSLVIWFERLAA
jgi:transposase-like protein